LSWVYALEVLKVGIFLIASVFEMGLIVDESLNASRKISMRA